MQALVVLLGQQGICPIWMQPVNRPWEGDDEFLKSAASADIVVVNGEGSIHHANPRAKMLSMVGTLCRSTLRKPSVLLNATLFGNDESVYKSIRNFDLVAVRDKASVVEAGKFGVSNVVYCPDLSMFHDLRGFRRVKPAPELRVGITDSVMPRVREILLDFGREHGLLDCSIRFKKQARKSIYDYADKIGDLDLLVTGRFHSVCFAIGTRTPFVAVESNTPKISSLLSDILGSTERVVKPEQLYKMDIDRLSQWTAAETAALDAFFERKDSLYQQLGVRIRQLLAPDA